MRKVQDNAATLGIVGGAFLLWTSLSLFSVLESAFNIVYGKPNRSFLHGKAIASILMLGSLVTLFVALLVGSLGVAFLRRYTPERDRQRRLRVRARRSLVSSLGVFVFVVSVYYLLTNAELTVREVLPGAVLATVVLEAGFQVLPVYVRYTDLNPVLKTFGAAGDPARLALRDGERARVRRRAQLVGGSGARNGREERPRGSRRASAAAARAPVRVRPLPLVAELRDGPLLAVGDEDRVVAEAFAAARLVDDAALERAGAAVLRAVGIESATSSQT